MEETPELAQIAAMAEAQQSAGQQDGYSFQQQQNTILELSLVIQDILEQIEHSWKGEYPKYENGRFVAWIKTPDLRPAMNEKGIQTIMGILRKFGNRVHALTSLNEIEIYNTASDMNHVINKELALNYREWEVDLTQYSEVCASASYFIFSVLKQAEEGMTRQLAMTMTKRTEISDESPGKKGGGFLDIFGYGGK